MYQESFGGRKTVPRGNINRRAADNKPDVPATEVKSVRDLANFVPDRNGQSVIPVGLVETTRTRSKDQLGRVVWGTVVTPLVRKPITPTFETSHGGRRVGGGGTSREAIRRAKKKSRKTK